MMAFDRYPENKKYFTTDMIYHYTKLETALEKILQNRSLRFSSFLNVNDPNECAFRDITVTYNRDRYDGSKIDVPNYLKIVNEVRLERSKLICFSQNSEKISRMQPLTTDDYYETGFFKPRMWAQYGEFSRGICLSFSKDSLVTQIEKEHKESYLYRSKIRYSDSSKEIRRAFRFDVSDFMIENFDHYFIKEHLVKYREQLFFTKNSDWRDEREYRFLLITDNDKEYHVGVKGSLQGIFCGVNFPDVYIHSLKQMTRDLNVDIFKLSLDNGEPHVYRI